MLIALVLLLSIAFFVFTHEATPLEVLRRAVVTSTPLGLMVTFAFVPSVSANIFAAWSCESFQNVDAAASSATAGPATIEFLRKDPSVICTTTKEHDDIVRAASVLMAIWPIGVPFLYTLLLVKARRPILARTPTTLTRATGFLHRDYRPEVGGK